MTLTSNGRGILRKHTLQVVMIKPVPDNLLMAGLLSMEDR